MMPHHVVSIIDDDPSVREGTTDLLNSAGYAAESFNDADAFLKSGRLDATSCVVADMRMPGISGIELHDYLLRAGRAIPTILITAYPREPDRAHALEVGVWGYLTKPFAEKDLLSSVRSALDGARRTFPDRRNDAAPQDIADQPGLVLASRDLTLCIEELSGPAALEAITPEWEKLDAEVSPRTPFTSPLWAKLWWHHLRQARASIRQEFFVHAVRDETGRLLAIVPLVMTRRPASGPLQLRLLQFFGGADGSITEHRCILCREGDESRVIQALASYLYDRKEIWDVFVWTGIRHSEIAHDRPGSQLRVYKRMPYYLVPLPDSWEKFRSGLSANVKEAIRKCYRHLARDGHAFTFRAIAQPEDIPISLQRLLALHSERAQLKYATRHRDLFAKPSHRAFIADVARLMAERGQLRIFELEVDGEVVASRMAFLLGDELYLYYSGYDLEWRKHSIMTTLMCECFKWAIERGIKVVNLSKGKDPSKLRWRGREAAYDDALLMSPTRRGDIISRGYDLVSNRPDIFVKLTELLTIIWGFVSMTRHAASGFC
jgi:FixJ family two-component response regulator/CelD/BcsL family acetyltransferase involved in cellulose biosynthesis